MERSADVSVCGRYRYALSRVWEEPRGRCVFVMLNPSTADAQRDDATIRKCVGFAQRWGFGRLDVVNLFAWRCTDPRGLVDAPDPIGPENDDAIHAACIGAKRVVCAWGTGGDLLGRGRAVGRRLLEHGVTLSALKLNAAGSPAHPLYQRGDLCPVPWEPA